MGYSTTVTYQDLPEFAREIVNEEDCVSLEQDGQTGDITVILREQKDMFLPEELPALYQAQAIIMVIEGKLSLTFPTLDEDGEPLEGLPCPEDILEDGEDSTQGASYGH